MDAECAPFVNVEKLIQGREPSMYMIAIYSLNWNQQRQMDYAANLGEAHRLYCSANI